MNLETYTCPFTGAQFQAVRLPDSLIVTNPLTGDQVQYPVADSNVLVSLKGLESVKVMTAAEAAGALGVSRQRVDQLAAAGTIRQRYVNGCPVYIASDIVEYRGKRKNGRPRKE